MAYPDDFDPRRLDVPHWASEASDAADDAEGDLRDLRALLTKAREIAKRMGDLSVGGIDADDLVAALDDALEGETRAVAARNRTSILDSAKAAA
ncbi:MAG: hypothetical protein ACU0DT_17800 [Albimonas sp.]|uniref:hypothetical protein n=1 Tax=Albimonas sp. TaxID=1872425 RepID=UPI00405667F2